MQLFLDTANVDEIKEINAWGVLSGVTTNPSLIVKEGREFKKVVKEICNIVDGPVSAEVTAEDVGGRGPATGLEPAPGCRRPRGRGSRPGSFP